MSTPPVLPYGMSMTLAPFTFLKPNVWSIRLCVVTVVLVAGFCLALIILAAFHKSASCRGHFAEDHLHMSERFIGQLLHAIIVGFGRG